MSIDPRSAPVDPKWIRGPADVLAISQGCWFDADAGNFVCDFIERFCRQSKGRWGGQLIKLIDWQRDFLMRFFGWKLPNGLRRYRTAYIEVGKKNGKSCLVSAIVLVLLMIDGEASPEIYLNAVDRSQAAIIFDEAVQMVEASPDLKARLKVHNSQNAKAIIYEAEHGKIVANSADVPNKDGVNASGIVFDELHRQEDEWKLWNIFQYASVSREQPIKISITTAGEAEEGPWFFQREWSEDVNRGAVDDITHLGVVYRALETDDLDDPATWRKANPSLGVTINEDDFAREYEQAKRSPILFAEFKRLRLNIIARNSQKFLTPEAWLACGGEVDPHEIAGQPCYMGLDLSSTQDLSALVAIIPNRFGGFDILPKFYLPEDNIVDLERQHNQPYREWANTGLITLTPGNVIDYEFIRQDVLSLAERHPLRKLGADKRMADQVALQLQQQGLPVEFVAQTTTALNGPTKELERLVLAKRIRHGNHPILRWMVGNTVLVMDSTGLVKPSKTKSKKKIDGVSALIDAIAVGTCGEAETNEPCVYDNRGVLYV